MSDKPETVPAPESQDDIFTLAPAGLAPDERCFDPKRGLANADGTGGGRLAG